MRCGDCNSIENDAFKRSNIRLVRWPTGMAVVWFWYHFGFQSPAGTAAEIRVEMSMSHKSTKSSPDMVKDRK